MREELEQAQEILDTWLSEGASYAELKNEMEVRVEQLLSNIRMSYLDYPVGALGDASDLRIFIVALQQLKEMGE